MMLIGGLASAAITLTGAAGNVSMLTVAPDSDKVTLNPDPATLAGGASQAVKDRLAAEFAGYTFTYLPTTLKGTINITTYTAFSYGPHNGAGRIFLTYDRHADDPALGTLNFIQLVTTSDPLGGGTSPYIDPRPNDDTEPYYWTDAEAVAERNAAANGGDGSLAFRDTSSRNCATHPDNISWRGSLLVAAETGANTAHVYAGVNWGWDFVCQPTAKKKAVRSPIPESPPDDSLYRFDGTLEFDVEIPGFGLTTMFIDDLVLSDFSNQGSFESLGNVETNFDTNFSGRVNIPGLVENQRLDGNGFVQFGAFGRGLGETGTFQTEIVAMSLSGSVPAPVPSGFIDVLLRESPGDSSFGELSVSGVINAQSKDDASAPPPPADDFIIDSFFDVFTEISVDGGGLWGSDKNGAATATLVPEPSACLLLVLGLIGIGPLVRRRRRAA